ncbi:methyltransferase [Citricoccus sp.]|nr:MULTISPECIES: methyltransferase [Micrococcaceae]MBB5749782.1 SAM-dependent methyltransferase [Micrococcus sp. TA1]HRO29333.1 methyltransferase [Citricoccus sp.]HRO92634.1 methyltransferase [Citricoccus sp.]
MTQMHEPPPPGRDRDAITRLAAGLRALPYTTDAVGDLLGETAGAALDREQAEPARRRVAQVLDDDGAPASQRALAAVVSCWMLGDAVPVAALDAALPSLGAGGAVGLNLGRIGEGHFHPVVDLSPYSADDLGEAWIASDQTALQTRGVLPPWHVLGIGRASLTLAGNVIRRPVARALDLGVGCGIQTLHLLAHAGHVTATDLSGRALDFTAFNLVLNAGALGLDPDEDPFAPGGRVTLRAGDLLDPVAGERFDLVVSNPPFVITPRTAGDADGINTYRDGGREGDRLLADLVRRLPGHLEPGGTAQLLGNWELHDADGGWDARLRDWIPAGTDAWLIQRDVADPARYAETWLQDSSEQYDPAGYAAGYRRYLEDFDARGVAAVGFGYLWLRRPEAPRAGRVRAEDLQGELQQPLGPAWGAAVQRWDLVEGRPLAGLHVRVPADVTEERHQRFGAEHPEVILARQGGGFRRVAHLDTATAGFLSAADGEFTVGQLTGAVAGLLELDAEAEGALTEAVRHLLLEGFLEAV